jgi:hypothetical protein
MIPLGLGLAWMGYALLAGRPGKRASAVPGKQPTSPEAANAA